METTPAPSHPIAQSSNRLFVAGIWMLVLAALFLSCGLSSGMFYLITPFLVKNRDTAIQGNIFLGSFAALGLAFGAVWAWQGIGTLRGRAIGATARVFPRVSLLVVVFLFALVLGIGALTLKPIVAFIFPPIHFLAATLPPLALLAYAVRHLGLDSGLRAFVTALSWGALGSTFLALSLEILIGVIIVIGVGVALALMPDRAAQIARLTSELRALQTLDDQAVVQRLLSNPGVIAAAGVYLAGIVPFIEEACKTLIIAFADPRRTAARDALLWGIAAGAGFALVENALNTGAALSVWAIVMVIRIGATVMHIANGATMARGWYAARVERRWSRLFIAYLVSVFLHAAWNALAIGQGIGAVSLKEPRAWIDPTSGLFWLNLACLFGLLVLTFGDVGWIVYSVRTVRHQALQKI